MNATQIKSIILIRNWQALASIDIYTNWRDDTQLDHMPPPPASLPADLDGLCAYMASVWGT